MGSSRSSNDPFDFARGGGKRIVNFTVTDGCNASCVYCSFHRNRSPRIVGLAEARAAIDFLAENDVGVLSLTGGEPFLNPDLPDMVGYAKERGLIVLTGTNGTMLDEGRLAALRDAGLDAMWISCESADARTFEENRGIPGLDGMVREGVRACGRLGLNVFCIALINRSMGDVPAFTSRLAGMGFASVKFDYPMSFPLQSTYMGWSDSPLLRLSGEEMERTIRQVLDVKGARGKGAIRVINPVQGLLGAIEHYHGRRPAFRCTAGEKVLYLDTHLEFYRCPALPDVLGEVGGGLRLGTIDCERCYYQGVRDFDAFYYLLSRFDEGLGHLLSGRLDRASRLLEPRFRLALADAWDIRNSGLV
jgi:MoaA/NifB/PqqE/SkfB family radical SAM enzyme